MRKTSEGRISGRIVETEAYEPDDASCHAFRGKSRANAALFARRGTAYVYMAYGSSWMLNLASEREGVGAGVLIRALEPLEGIELMQRFRGTTTLRDLTRGPGRLAEALNIDRRFDGVDLCTEGPLWLGTASAKTGRIGVSERIGISRETHRPLRFFEIGSRFVSGPRALNAQDAATRAGM